MFLCLTCNTRRQLQPLAADDEGLSLLFISVADSFFLLLLPITMSHRMSLYTLESFLLFVLFLQFIKKYRNKIKTGQQLNFRNQSRGNEIPPVK